MSKSGPAWMMMMMMGIHGSFDIGLFFVAEIWDLCQRVCMYANQNSRRLGLTHWNQMKRLVIDPEMRFSFNIVKSSFFDLRNNVAST